MTEATPHTRSFASRLMRGAGQTTFGFVAAQGLRFLSNLILARLLFPEAFGLMALVSVILIGAVMLSDAGIGQSIRQSPRGDDPVFLNTAWTMKVLRGALLWAVVALLAGPAARFFEAPELALMLPVAGATLLLAGFEPMKVEQAYRHLAVARVTVLELTAQVAGLAVMIGLALHTGSVWSLIAGMLATSLVKTTLFWLVLPGRRNGLGWEAAAVRELFHFGIWIFLSSACGFLMSQGDKAILGRFLSQAELGIYNIAFFLASAPMLLAGALTGALLLPAYRIAAEEGAGAQARVRRLRVAMTGAVMAMLAIMALAGPALVGALYDDRYQAAGHIVTWIALVQMWPLIGITYDQAALAAGKSRSFFWVIAFRAAAQTLCFIAGFMVADLPGALAGQATGAIIAHGAIIWLARRHAVWDMRHDLIAAGIAALLAFWLFDPSALG